MKELTPNLARFESTNYDDVLVQYDAFSEKHPSVKRRAYHLHMNQTRVDAGTKPAELAIFHPTPSVSPVAVRGQDPYLPTGRAIGLRRLGITAPEVGDGVTREHDFGIEPGFDGEERWPLSSGNLASIGDGQ
jgi:hypothetical protein